MSSEEKALIAQGIEQPHSTFSKCPARTHFCVYVISMGAGQGIDRVVVTSSPTDAIALAAMARVDVKTMFVAVEHPDRIPTQLLRGAIAKQRPVIVARGSGDESDRVVSVVVNAFPEITRIRVP